MNYKAGGSFNLDPASGAVGVVQSVVAGDNVTVDSTDPANPVVSATGGGGGGLESVVAGTNILVDTTDPANPVVSLGVDELPGILVSTDLEAPQVYAGAGENDFLVLDGLSHAVQLSSGSTLDVIGQTVTLGPPTDDTAVVTIDGDGASIIGDVSLGGDSQAHVNVNGSGVIDLNAGGGSQITVVDSNQITLSSDAGVSINSDKPFRLPTTADVGLLDPTEWEGCMIYDGTNHAMVYSNGTDWLWAP